MNILATSLATALLTDIFGTSGVALATAVMTILILVFGEIAPKIVAKAKAELCALGCETIIGNGDDLSPDFFCG